MVGKHDIVIADAGVDWELSHVFGVALASGVGTNSMGTEVMVPWK